MTKITFEEVVELILRFTSRPKHYYGDLILKFRNGECVNVRADDSFDIISLKEKIINLEKNTMFIKTGSPVKEDKDSSKIIATVEIDEKNNIVKESKIIKEDKENNIKTENNINKGK